MRGFCAQEFSWNQRCAKCFSFTDINFRQWATKTFLQPNFRKFRISLHISPPQISPSTNISPCCFFIIVFLCILRYTLRLNYEYFYLCKKIPVLHTTRGLRKVWLDYLWKFRQIPRIRLRWGPNTAKQKARMIPFTTRSLP